MQRKIFFTLLILTLFVHPFFCKNTSAAQSRIHLKVGYVPLTSQLPLVLSSEFERESAQSNTIILVKYTSFTSLEAALRIGAIDVASIPIPIALSIAADKIPIRILGSIHTGGSSIFMKKSVFGSIWKDKVIGVPGLDSGENLRLRDALTKQNFRYGLDYKTISVPFITALSDLKSGRVDALFFPEPFGTQAMLSKEAVFAEIESSIFLQGKLSTLVVRSHLLEGTNYQIIKEWLEKVAKACAVLENDEYVNNIRCLFGEGFGEETIRLSLKNRPGGIRYSLFPPDLNELQNILQKTLVMKLIYRSVALDNLIAPGIMQEVLDSILLPGSDKEMDEEASRK